MNNLKVDFSKILGRIRPMHCVNNGPIIGRGGSNAEYFKESGIPYARLHDSNGCGSYGGPHTVDIHSVFPDFDKDPFDPASYDFACTDKYINNIISVGTEPFYRLGATIEHSIKKYHIFPPKDNLKWAQICEGIIRHYTEGWADGFHHNIKYWEIWNEPDTGYKEGNSPTWRGTMDEFFAMFKTALCYLKEKFPHLKIGGPSLCSVTDSYDILCDMMEYLTTGERAPLDFFSWHMYGIVPQEEFTRKIRIVKDILQKYGYADTENILNEWNYVKAWTNMYETYAVIKSLKGAAFASAAMSTCQREGLDMLMYYDARPCNFNGLFDSTYLKPLKGYYPFYMFNKLYELGNEAYTETDQEELCLCASIDGDCGRIMITYYDDDEHAGERDIKLDITGFGDNGDISLTYYILDETHDCEIIREEISSAKRIIPRIKLSNYSVVLIELKNI